MLTIYFMFSLGCLWSVLSRDWTDLGLGIEMVLAMDVGLQLVL